MIRHIVLFRFRAEVSEEKRKSAEELLKNLGESVSVVHHPVVLATEKNGTHYLLEAFDFPDKDAFETFNTHSEHKKAQEYFSAIADWVKFDYSVPKDPPGPQESDGSDPLTNY